VFGINASNISEDMGYGIYIYICTMPLSCMNSCDFLIDIVNNCEKFDVAIIYKESRKIIFECMVT